MGYRSNKALLTTVGIKVGPVQVGYSTEIPFSTYRTLAGPAHSVMLGISVNEKILYNKKKKKRKTRGYLPGRHKNASEKDEEEEK